MQALKQYFIDDFVKQIDFANKQKLKTADQFLNKVGYASYQKKLLFSLIILFLADGSEMVIISIILPCMTAEWDLSAVQRSFVSSIVFCGLSLGSFFSAKISDLSGRKKLLILGSGGIVVFGILTAFAPNYYFFVFFRFLLGNCIGIVIPASNSLAAESIPTYYRSFYLNNLWVCFPIGQVFISIIGMMLMPNLESENWQKMVAFAALPAFISFFFMLTIYESPRFLINNDRAEEGFEILNSLGKERGIQLTEEEKQALIEDNIEAKNSFQTEVAYSAVFQNPFLKITLMTFVIWYSCSIICYGSIYVLPQVLIHDITQIPISTDQSGSGISVFTNMIISAFIMLPSTLIGGYLSELKIFGRKYTMVIGFAIATVCSLLSYVRPESIALWNGFANLGIGIPFSVIAVYCAEIYPTKIRTIGIGVGYTITRIGGITAPFFCELIAKHFSMRASYIMFVLFGLLSCYISHKLPIETFQKSLDNMEELTAELRDASNQ